jgi:DNA invertase Pin-like site-specific DNA recombinase
MSNQRVAYLRLSEDDNCNFESMSIGNQRKIILQFANERGYEITEFYIDDGVSGYLWSRPAFDRLKQDIDDGLVEGIIVKDLSRLGRHNARVQLFNEDLVQRQVELISIGDNYNNLTDDDSMLGITTWANEKLVKDTSKKVRAVIHSKQKEGKWVSSNVPYGYRRIYGKKHTFEIDPITSVYVKRIFDWYVNGYGGMNIARMLNDEGVPTPTQALARIREENGLEPSKRTTAELWSSTHVKRIINNEFYIGTLVQRKMQVLGIHGRNVKRDKSENLIFPDHHEAIIDKETFYLAQKVKDERATKHHKGVRKHFNIFTGLIFCGDCGKPLTPRSGVNKRRYYVCSTYNFYGANYCNHNRVYEDELIEFVKVYLRQCRHSLKGAIENLDNIIQKELKQVCDVNAINSIDALKKELDKTTNELKGLMEQKVKDIIKNPAMKDILEETYQQAINDKSNYIQSLKTQIDEQQSVSQSSKEVRTGLNKALLLFDEIITSDKLTVKQLKLLVDKIVVHYNGGIDIYMNGNLNEVMSGHIDISLGSIDIYKKAIIDTIFELKEFHFGELHKIVAKKGYKEGYYSVFMPIINKLESAGIIVRTPRPKDKNYISGTKEEAYMLFNLYTEGYIQGYRCTFNVTFMGLLKICKWAKRIK